MTLRNKLNGAEVVVPVTFARGYVDRTPTASRAPDPAPVVDPEYGRKPSEGGGATKLLVAIIIMIAVCSHSEGCSR